MTTFITLFRMTGTGRKEIVESLTRGDVVNQKLARLGVKRTGYFMTLGTYDFVFTFEAPDEKAMAHGLLEIGRLGAVETQTLTAIEPEDYEAMLTAMAGHADTEIDAQS